VREERRGAPPDGASDVEKIHVDRPRGVAPAADAPEPPLDRRRQPEEPRGRPGPSDARDRVVEIGLRREADGLRAIDRGDAKDRSEPGDRGQRRAEIGAAVAEV
jgi:hypothetical protein